MEIENGIFEDGRIPALNELILKPLPVKEAYKVAKLAKELREKEEVYREAKTAIFRKYGKEKNGKIEIMKKNQEKALEEINELIAVKEEYSLKDKIKLPEDIELSAQQIILLEDLVEI